MAALDPRRPPYEYVTLEEATTRQGLQNLYAVVLEATIPRKTQGTDYVSNLTLTDSSLGVGQNGFQRECQDTLELLCFAPEPHALPRLQQANDIIRLHRVKVGQYNGRTQLVAKIGRPCHFTIFSRDTEAAAVPYQQSSSSFFWDEREGEMLLWLRRFLGVGLPLPGSSTYLKRIKDLQPGMFFDCVCLVLAVQGSGSGAEDVQLHVWDGSDAQPLPAGVEASLEPPDGLTLEEWRPARQPALTVSANMPVLGTALRVCMHNMPERPTALPFADSWIKLRNIAANVADGQLLGLYHRNSKWTLCDRDSQALQEDRRRQDVNNVAAWAPADPEELMASSGSSNPFTTLRQVHQDAEKRVPSRYHCLVRVTASAPTQVVDMCSSRAACNLLDDTGQPQQGWVYTLQLGLEDATGELHAMLFDTDGQHFFQEIHAQDLSANHEAAAQLHQTICRLRGLDNDRPGGTWIDCCLRSYFLPHASSPDAQVFYRIFDTRMRSWR